MYTHQRKRGQTTAFYSVQCFHSNVQLYSTQGNFISDGLSSGITIKHNLTIVITQEVRMTNTSIKWMPIER